jgi:ribose transport system substrate-binding protein
MGYIFLFRNIPEGEKDKRRVFGATYMNMVNPFFTVVDDGIREIIEAQGDKLISFDPGNDQLKQLDQIQELINMHVDAIFLNPVDWQQVKPGLLSAKKANIPVINIDTPVYDIDLVDCLVMSDNVQAGKLLAEDLIQRKSSARIAIIDHLSAKSALDRVKGFSSIISEKNTYKIVARFSSDGNIEQALLGMENILKLRTQVDVAFATNDPSAMGVLAALEAAQLTGKVLVYGVDGAPYAKRMILEGKMTATVAQSPVEIGRTAAEMTYQLLKGKEIKRTILVPVFLIKAENVQQYGINGWQ